VKQQLVQRVDNSSSSRCWSGAPPPQPVRASSRRAPLPERRQPLPPAPAPALLPLPAGPRPRPPRHGAAMDLGRVHCFLVATKSGAVVYERFYHRCSGVEAAEVRQALQQAAANVNLSQEGQEFVGQLRRVRRAAARGAAPPARTPAAAAAASAGLSPLTPAPPVPPRAPAEARPSSSCPSPTWCSSRWGRASTTSRRWRMSLIP
jgi:hypothetical protein